MVNTKLGRFHAPEPLSALARLHLPEDPLATHVKPVDHEPKIAVLDQEDLHAQGIKCSEWISGADDPDALGSCTANTTVEALSNILTPAEFREFMQKMGGQPPSASLYADTVSGERAAIGFYHRCTDQTNSTATEWPPTDCGSSGPYMYQEAKTLGVVQAEVVAQHTAASILGLLQADGLCWGTPWFQAWFEPDSAGFIDGNGS